MLEFWELCEHVQCTWYMILRYIPYFYCFSEHFASIPFYFVVYSRYTGACTVVSYLFASVTYRDNQNLIPHLVQIMWIIKAFWFDYNTWLRTTYITLTTLEIAFQLPRKVFVKFPMRVHNKTKFTLCRSLGTGQAPAFRFQHHVMTQSTWFSNFKVQFPSTFIVLAALIVSHPQIGLLNNSYLHNINSGTFYNVTGDSHIYNLLVSSSTHCMPPHCITLILSQPCNV